MKKKRFTILYVTWGVLLLGSYLLSIYLTVYYNKQIVKEASRAFFNEIVTTRAWNASHEGVYLIVNDQVQPNPYLEDSLRDLTTTNGIDLTKVNPAYMTRQISEIARDKDGIQYRITSLNPIRPENEADLWEHMALESFDHGVKDLFELVETDTLTTFRYMAPLLAKPACLKCHAKQGYSLGQVRGGISVTTPSEGFFDNIYHQIFIITVIFLIILVIGFGGILFFQRMVNRQFRIIQDQNTELARHNLEKDMLFSIVAHDLRSHISGMHGLSKILFDELDTFQPEEIVRITRSIYNSSENVIKLSEHLIQWYNTRKGTLDFTPENFILIAAIEEAVELYSENAQKKEISISFDIPVDMKVYADLNMIETVLRNLISNALKYTSRGGRIELTAEDSKDPDFIKVIVKDNGIGIDQQTSDQLFERDFHTSQPGTEHEQGIGLGLAICHEFIEKNGGSIHISSTLNVGSQFIFTIPKGAKQQKK